MRILIVATTLFFVTESVRADESGKEATDLLGGGDLGAWQNTNGGEPMDGWKLADGILSRTDKAGYIWTKERYGDFVLELDFKTGGNSGIFIRTADPKNSVQTGIEIQVDRPKDPSKHSVGAIYDLVAPTKNAANDDWNHIVITARDNAITVELNGEKVSEMDLNLWTEAGKNPDGSKNKFKTALKDFAREGHIGFQDHGANVSYRNVRVRRL